MSKVWVINQNVKDALEKNAEEFRIIKCLNNKDKAILSSKLNFNGDIEQQISDLCNKDNCEAIDLVNAFGRRRRSRRFGSSSGLRSRSRFGSRSRSRFGSGCGLRSRFGSRFGSKSRRSRFGIFDQIEQNNTRGFLTPDMDESEKVDKYNELMKLNSMLIDIIKCSESNKYYARPYSQDKDYSKICSGQDDSALELDFDEDYNRKAIQELELLERAD